MSALMALAHRLHEADAEQVVSDEDALMDALQAEAPDCVDVLHRVIRASMEADALVDAAEMRMKVLSERRDRFRRRRDMLRGAAFAAMDALGLRKVESADFTASIRPAQPRVLVTEEAALPDEYWRVTRAPDLTAVREAMKHGVVVPGVEVGNGNPSLTIRSR